MLFWSLVLFFIPYKSRCSRSKIIRSPFDLCSSSCSFISSISDHKFISVYWPKFTGKAETKRNHLHIKKIKNKPSEPQKPVTVHRTGWSDRSLCRSLLFLHGTVLHPKQIVKLYGSRFFRSDLMVRSGFQNLALQCLLYLLD